jgi:hypothetical protein
MELNEQVAAIRLGFRDHGRITSNTGETRMSEQAPDAMTQAATTRLGLPIETISDNPIPSIVMSYVSVEGVESVFGARRGKKLNKSSKAYHAKKSDRDSVRRDIERTGFSIIAETSLGFSVAAPPGAYEELTGAEVRATELLVYSDGGYSEYLTHLDIVGPKQPATRGVGIVSLD